MTAAGTSGADDRKGRCGNSGFTLIELLIALTLFGLLSVALVGGLRFGTRVWERGHEQSAAFTEVEAVHGFFRQLLEQARLSVQVLDDRRQSRGFVGSSDRIEFLAPLPQPVGLGGLYSFHLSGTTEGGTEQLVLSWTLYRPDQVETVVEGAVSQRVLLDNIEGLSLRYYGALEADQDAEWHDEWKVEARLPRLISIDLAFPAGDLRLWPEFVVAPVAARHDVTS
jgi:general secretion pathway protein J